MEIEYFSKQLETIIEKSQRLESMGKYTDLSDLPDRELGNISTQAISAVQRITGKNSSYSKQIKRILKTYPPVNHHYPEIIGVTKALKEDLDNGYIKSLMEIVHQDIFSDFLEMASYFNDKSFKDAAAVIAGSTLENHLKQLAEKNEINQLNDKGKPKRADLLNAELMKNDVYEKLDNKNVTAWLDLRNKAAHGDYENYSKEQVNLLIDGIRNFITRIPA
ncbi:hypothetical protein [Christiangramia forsetii]|uniref:DUF4145 domain-containing protein n=2 Tax=Christiangramia forsetii TaxID=411153 RepID=A0LZP8_CHRFK|nr:hypothetical protein [Christiangramia forsetii]GGG46654.1 hypothetical protein GCM10011532_33210 [Christiangramia forsetii]CAL65843.1 hypothetical protein GFO_0869 [Christiangramia forsetii KT0803]